MSTKYAVIVEPFAERHFIKSFRKKYKGAWNTTYTTLNLLFQSFDVLFDKSIAETIIDSDTIKICKVEFKISGSNQSRHSSGNRCIVAIDKEKYSVHVLIVYMKTDVRGTQETVWWKEIVKNNYPEYKDFFG